MTNDYWSEAAKLRVEQIESGIDKTFHCVFLPLWKNRLAVHNTNCVLEVGAGTGHLAKRIYSQCSELEVIDSSAEMINVSRAVLQETNVKVIKADGKTYRPEANKKYTIIYSHMCFHTTSNLEQLVANIYNLLESNGSLLFSIPHPCFYEDYKRYFADSYDYYEEMFKTVKLNISTDPERFLGEVPFFHRPLEQYTDLLFQSNFCITGLKELSPKKEDISDTYPLWDKPRYLFIECKKLVPT
ncbi:class I SAM-dependent methyltransferase [Pseudoalteromonas piscicida]|uniref:Methyltransferase domain-containing protein n=1 Tax=Pseudoalteromonas piscicida TaxID=43662 RepID=A0A2A5JQ83_PSEO7|nr:class I SAM-dependent methyltransferase [Pseudoalteromonas piscicida]PCK31578.1 hypothetical protein CEX98_11470 [Pseudoalteromonas piscicida]